MCKHKHLMMDDKNSKEFKSSLLPFCYYAQSENFLNIKIKCDANKINFFYTEIISSKIFKFHYKYLGNGLVPLIYGCLVYTAPYTFKNKGVTSHILDNTLTLNIEKKKPIFWQKIKVGVEQRKLKEVKLQSCEQNETYREIKINKSLLVGKENVHRENISGEDSKALHETIDNKDINETPTLAEENSSAKSAEIKIPKMVRRTSDYFLTGSWPRGILKVRSRSLSDSQMDLKSSSTSVTNSYCNGNAFSSSFECEDESLAEEEEENKFDQETGDDDTGESTKKSVRFNDHVCKQLFRRNASILGQKVKKQKKAQRKLARERKLSEEGSQSSETENVTDQSDAATTEEDSSAEIDGAKKKEFLNMHNNNGLQRKAHRKNTKRKGQKYSGGHKNKNNSMKKYSLNLSNEMVFQLDEI